MPHLGKMHCALRKESSASKSDAYVMYNDDRRSVSRFWVVLTIGLVVGFVVASTFASHWLWNTSWMVSAWLVPVALGSGYAVFKIWIWLD